MSLENTFELPETVPDINPVGNSYEGPLEFSSFNAYFALPPELKPVFLEELKFTGQNFHACIRQVAYQTGRGEKDALVQDRAKGLSADYLAERFDPKYRTKRNHLGEIDPRVGKLREIFYMMIVAHDQNQIASAAKKIEEIEKEQS